MRRLAIVVAGLALALTACWPTTTTSGPRLGDPPPDGHHYAWRSIAWQFYGCHDLPDLRQCADSLRIGIGKPQFVDPEPGLGGGMPAYRVDWKDPARLSNPPAGSPGIVLRIEFTNTVNIPNDATCPAPGAPGKKIEMIYSARSNVTAVNCTVTADERMLIDIGLERRVGYRIGRCFDAHWQTGTFDIRFEPPPDADHAALGWCPVEWQTG